MNLLNKLTIKNLKLNKKRTAVTIIGIILSTALITGVATLVTSFRESLINEAKESDGNFHYEFSDVPTDEIKYIENNRNVKEVYITQNIGYAPLENSKNEYKPYLYVQAFDQKAIDNLSLKLIEGRMPKNENELVISSHIKNNGGVEYKAGERITLNIGKRTIDGEELNQSNPYMNEEGEKENFESKYSKEYEIVGIIERPNYNMENYSAPGYTVITYLENYENISGTANIYTLYKDLNKQYDTTGQILELNAENVKKHNLENAKYNFEKNDSLIRWEILEFSDSTVTMLYSVAGVIIAIIIFTSVFCIRNSFEISITERIRQYGMLASVGATSNQIKKNVLYEGLILGIIGIPLGILSGLLAIFILLQVVQNILGDMLGDNFTFMFRTSSLAIIISILLCGITIYLSARKSAKKAAKVAPIDAIRNSQDIKIKKLRSHKIIKKLFGIGGDIAYKNLKRNKKKYRATVISIVVSVSVFIAMTSFFTYAFTANDMYNVKKDYNILVRPIGGEKYNEVDYSKINEILNQSNVKDYSILNNMFITVEQEKIQKHYSEKYKEIYLDSEEEKEEELEDVEIVVTSLNDEKYKAFLKEIGIKFEDAKDKAILLDDMKIYNVDENGKGKYELFRVYDYKKGDKIDFELREGEEIVSKDQVEIVAVTDKRPMGLEVTNYHYGNLIVTEEWLQKYQEYLPNSVGIYINSNNTQELADFIDNNFKGEFYVYDYEEDTRQQNSMWLVIAIFIYGFITVISLIGVTSIFNTITTNMKLRSKEFANLKSIGMTKKEFDRMIRLESIFYCGKSLFWGILIGIGLSYAIYLAVGEGIEMGFIFPVKGIIISIIAVAILITIIMQYSLNKINKQNIIETIRKDNI